jgi:predicted RNA binding protein YcfA (HicA-like mRNA interferase family)
MNDILGTIHPRLHGWVFSEVSIIKAVEAAGWVYVRPKGDQRPDVRLGELGIVTIPGKPTEDMAMMQCDGRRRGDDG